MIPQIKNFAYTYLGEAMDASQTTMRVKTGTGTTFLTPDATQYGLVLIARSRGFYDLAQAELVRLDSVDGGDSDLYDVVQRNYDGRIIRAHAAGELVLANIFAEHFTAAYGNNELIKRFIGLSLGGATGIIRTDGNDLKVQPHSSDMKIKVSPGDCLINFELVSLVSEFVSDTIAVAASGKVRLDLVQINSSGVVSILTGTEVTSSPVAPDPSSNSIALGTVAVNHSISAITKGEITDARNFY